MSIGQTAGRGACLAAAAVLLTAAAADDPLDRLKNPQEEARARHLFREIRCLVCQNESIDESDAGLADDLRRIVRARVAAGASDGEIKSFLVSRYGEFVLERPVFSVPNALLWGAPFAVIGVGGVLMLLRRKKPLSAEAPLSDEEEKALAALTQPKGQ
jgi:cytochrome c-type biogenesis protein CcmH